ncbi:hypothetical protein VDGD_20342 [Verticillium dahliae]|nr:hypothetical protein VDGD_20342 [Verticillium dahliae]
MSMSTQPRRRMAEMVRWTCSMQGEKVQRWAALAGSRGDTQGPAAAASSSSSAEGNLSAYSGAVGRARDRCGRASQGAGRSRKTAEALGLAPSTRKPPA